MCAAVKCVCGGEPKRVDVKGGRYLFACTAEGCGHYAEPAFSGAAAATIWNNANSIEHTCLGCHKLPRLRYNSKRQMWSMQCQGCRWATAGAHSAQGAITAWIRANKPNDTHIKSIWLARYAEQRAL